MPYLKGKLKGELKVPEIRKLVRLHNELSKIKIPPKSSRDDIIALIEKSGYKIDHANTRLVKTKTTQPKVLSLDEANKQFPKKTRTKPELKKPLQIEDKQKPKEKTLAKEDTSECVRLTENIFLLRNYIREIFSEDPYSEIKKGYGQNAVSYEVYRKKFIKNATDMLNLQKKTKFKCPPKLQVEIEQGLEMMTKLTNVKQFNNRNETDEPKGETPKKDFKVRVNERKKQASQYFNQYDKTIYQVLKPFGISSEAKGKTFSPAELKNISRKIFLKYHPDKGGDPEEFDKFNIAIKILLNTVS